MAGRIPERTVRDIVGQTDMAAVVGEVVALSRMGSQLRGLCPFHTEKTPSFHVNPSLKVYHCKGCGAGGDVIRFVRETRGLSFVEAVELLAERAGVAIEREELSPHAQRQLDEERTRRARMLQLNRAAQAFFRERFDRPEGAAARAYAEGRGLGLALAERYGLGAAGTGLLHHLTRQGFAVEEVAAMGLAGRRDDGSLYDRFRNRLMFPIFTAAGDLVGFGGRDLGGNGDREVAKYMNSPESTLDGEPEDSRFHHFYKKGHLVFGLYQAREAVRRSRRAVLVEGNIDVMTLAQAGIDNAVCAMGTALTEQQVSEIKRFADEVALVYDGDAAGRKAAMKAVPLCVAAGLRGVLVVLPDGEDPDSFVRKHGVDAFRQRLASAPPMLEGYIDGLCAQGDGSVQGRSQIVLQAGPLLASIANPLERDMARDYLILRLEGGRLEDGRAQMQRYLSYLPATTPAAPAAPLPDPTWGEAEIQVVEQELAQVLVLYPALLGEFEAAGGLDLVRHDGLRLALRDLAGRTRQGEIDAAALAGWAQDLPDGRARRAVLGWLVDPPPVPAHQARRKIEELWGLLYKDRLDEQARSLKSEMRRQGLPRDRLTELAADLVRVQHELNRVAQEMRRAI